MNETPEREFTEKFKAESWDEAGGELDVQYRPFPQLSGTDESPHDPVWRVRFEVAHIPDKPFGLDINGEMILGRGNDSPDLFDLNPYGASDLGVSRQHLILRPTPNKLFAIDLGSTNGTYRNGRSFAANTPYSLMNGDIISLGHMNMVVTIIDRPRSQTTWLTREINLADAMAEIGEAITSQLELEEVFNQATEIAQALTAAGETSIWLIDEESSELVLEAERGIEDEQIRRMRIPITDDNPAGRVIQLGKPLSLSRQPDEEQIKLKTNYLVEAVIYVPIMLGGVTFGVLSAVHREPGKQFSQRDESLLRAIAQFAAIAIQNARLYEATDEALAHRVKELSVLNEVSRVVSASLDLERVYKVLVEQLNKYWPVEAIRLYRLNVTQRQLDLLFASGSGAPGAVMPLHKGIVGRVARTDTAVISNQLTTHPDYEPTVDDLQGKPPTSIASVPLRVQGNVIGVLTLVNKADGKFTNEDMKRLEALAYPMATAIENARLFTETKRQQATIETTAQVLHQPLIFLDNTGRIIFSNQKANTILEKDTDQLFAAINEGVGRTQEVELADKTYLSTTERVQDVGTIVVMQDITYVKQLEKDRSDFMHALSHDLKSPLTTITGWAQLLERVVVTEGKGQQYVQKLLAAARAMHVMIDQLLQSAVHSESVQVLKKSCQLDEIVTKAIGDIEGSALSKSIIVAYEQTGTSYALMADELRLYHMALNLVDNAIKYSPENTTIQVRLNFMAKAILLEVKDQGPGIPEEDLSRIFEKYYRGSQSGTTLPGSGLGLAVVKSIVEAHSGKIVAENNLNGGATFTVILPINSPVAA